ncbi:LptA/OstA family protein [Terasakiella sp. A23]|uniref:LptA/OstA family protein n=1 Tax=Terasakiella sp. FCG-A23 TaxID=3080561 RepID=UPI0029539E95|nr:LptA/OstA family protein [Terasakiella sp. A23]MDV7339470.1 LptA/OstA family protein [Terasakiella sp. A23]
MMKSVVPLALAFGFLASTGFAQDINLASGSPNAPLEIYADNGIEWQQNEQIIIAQGNAVAKRANVDVNADELRAYYTENEGDQTGNTNIHRLEALGGVTITSDTEKATGDRAVYDLKRAIMVISGSRPTLRTPDDTISADNTLEYWEEKAQAVARGNATAVREDRKIKADVIAALFRKDKQGKSEIHRVNAFGNVVIVTKTEHVSADKGIYNVNSGVATLTGAVKIKRGGNLLNGCSATVNLKTNISRLKACAGTNDNRVRGLVLPTAKSVQ